MLSRKVATAAPSTPRRGRPGLHERHFMAARLPLSALVLLFVLGLPACAPRPAVQDRPPREASVRPGINDPYRDPDVAEFIRRFESEQREVFAQREAIVRDLAIRPGAAVADIGAGTGAFTLLLAQATGPEGVVYAVDIVPEFLELIRERAEQAGLQNVRTVHCRDDSVDLPPGSIDVALLCDVYHHLEYPLSSMRSLHAALRPAGEVYVIDFEREEGVSSQWVLEHVRCGRQTVIEEISRAGLEPVDWRPTAAKLRENYFLRFRKR